jgi:hypothetical protein
MESVNSIMTMVNTSLITMMVPIPLEIVTRTVRHVEVKTQTNVDHVITPKIYMLTLLPVMSMMNPQVPCLAAFKKMPVPILEDSFMVMMYRSKGVRHVHLTVAICALQAQLIALVVEVHQQLILEFLWTITVKLNVLQAVDLESKIITMQAMSSLTEFVQPVDLTTVLIVTSCNQPTSAQNVMTQQLDLKMLVIIHQVVIMDSLISVVAIRDVMTKMSFMK